MTRSALIAAFAAALVEPAWASWQWPGRTVQQLQAAKECVPTDDAAVFKFANTDTTYPSDEVKQMESSVQVANLISIKYGQSFKVVTNSHAKEQYVLTQCGLGAPADSEVDKVEALPATYARKHFTIPLQKAIATTTVALGFVDALGVQDRMVAVSKYAVAPCWQKARKECSAELADQWSNKTLMELQYAAADGIFMDCSPSGCGMGNGIAFYATNDPGNLHQAEYIKIMAAFFNKEAEANTIFASKLQAYKAMAPVPSKPVVAWISFEAAASWNGNTASFVISAADYKLQMVKDAGLANPDFAALQSALPQLEKKGSSPGTKYMVNVSKFSDKAAASAAFFGAMGGVAAVVEEFYTPTPKDYTIATFYENYVLTSSSSLPFITNKKVIRVDGTISEDNALDWYESRIVNPAKAVEGLRHSVTGDASLKRLYFRNIAAGEAPDVLTAAMCKSTLPMCGSSQSPVYPAVIEYNGATAGATTTAAGSGATAGATTTVKASGATTTAKQVEVSGASVVRGTVALALAAVLPAACH